MKNAWGKTIATSIAILLLIAVYFAAPPFVIRAIGWKIWWQNPWLYALFTPTRFAAEHILPYKWYLEANTPPAPLFPEPPTFEGYQSHP